MFLRIMVLAVDYRQPTDDEVNAESQTGTLITRISDIFYIAGRHCWPLDLHNYEKHNLGPFGTKVRIRNICLLNCVQAMKCNV
jgi:hypothetical protein